jgi:hypothetical protein
MRPEIFTDLEPSARRGREVMRIDMKEWPANGPLLSALGTFLGAVEKARLTVSKDSYGGIMAYLPPTEQELEQALSDAKQNWDKSKQLYEAAEISGTEPEDYTRHQIRSWAKGENLPLPWVKEGEHE